MILPVHVQRTTGDMCDIDELDCERVVIQESREVAGLQCPSQLTPHTDIVEFTNVLIRKHHEELSPITLEDAAL